MQDASQLRPQHSLPPDTVAIGIDKTQICHMTLLLAQRKQGSCVVINVVMDINVIKISLMPHLFTN